MPDTMVDPQTGAPVQVQVVEPGSAEDPFTKGGGGTSTPAAQVVDPSAQAQVPAQTPAAESTPAATTPSTPAPEATPASAAEPVPGATDEAAELEAVGRLQTWLQEQLKAELEPALREQQGNYDRTINRLQEATRQATEREQLLQDRVRELQLNGLSDVEKEQMRRAWADEDRSGKLDAWETELDGYYREMLVGSYVTEFTQYGVTPAALAECETPEAMEILCLEAKATVLEQRANGSQPQVVPAGATATPAPRPAPAGAHAPSDVGGGGVPEPKPQFRTGQTSEDLAANLRNLEVANIRVR